MIRTAIRVLDLVERALTVFAAVLMGALAILVCWQVFARYVLRDSPYWIEEFSVIGMMWIGLVGAAACVWTGSHMSLELVVRRFPDRVRVWAELIIDLTIGAFAWFLMSQGWVLTEATMSSTMATIPFPLGLTYAVLPIAGGFMIIFGLMRAVRKFVEHYYPKGAGANG